MRKLRRSLRIHAAHFRNSSAILVAMPRTGKYINQNGQVKLRRGFPAGWRSPCSAGGCAAAQRSGQSHRQAWGSEAAWVLRSGPAVPQDPRCGIAPAICALCAGSDTRSNAHRLHSLTGSNLSDNKLSTARRQPGILVNVLPGLLLDTEVSQPQLPRSGPDGQPIESSQLERAHSICQLARGTFPQ